MKISVEIFNNLFKKIYKPPKPRIIMPKASRAEKKLDLMQFEKRINTLSREDLKDLLLIDTYKLALTRAQLEALAEILIKKKIMSYEEFWKLTNEKFKNVKP
jgi:hypothetical protein